MLFNGFLVLLGLMGTAAFLCVLLAFRATGAPDVRLLFGRDDGVALGAAVLARREGAWRVLWESAIAGCG